MITRRRAFAGLAAAAWMMGGSAARVRAAEPVDINAASISELMQVQGMTKVWAARIVHYRPYRTKQDLLDEGVVTADVYQRMRDGVVAHRNNQLNRK